MSRPADTRRDLAYRALRAAGEGGILEPDLHDQVGAAPGIHVESLRFEGHGIAVHLGRNRRGEPVRRYVLTEDAWAG